MQVEPVTQIEQLLLGHLLDLVRRVASLEARAERPALDRLAEDDRRATGAEVLGGRLVRRVELAVVVTTAGECDQLVVGEVRHHLAQALVGSEEVLPDVLTALDAVALELAVDRGVHLVEQHAVLVLRQELVPLRAPDHLDHVPARTTEGGLEFLDDLAVAAHRTVEALQVAVDDEHEVVELLTGGERDRSERLRFVALPVAEEGPHAAAAGVVDLAVLQIAVEAGVVQRGDRSEAHRHRGELPEVGHQPWVRVRRQALALASDLAAEVVEVVVGETTLEVRTGVDAGRGVSLEVDVIARCAVVLAAEEVVEADLVQRRRAGEGREVTTDAVGVLVRLDDHHRRVPADERPDPPLDVLVAREPRFLLARDRVHVRGRHGRRERDLCLVGPLHQPGEEVPGTGLAVRVGDGIEAVEPLRGLGGIDVGQLVYMAVEDHPDSLAVLPMSTHRPSAILAISAGSGPDIDPDAAAIGWLGPRLLDR